MNRMFSRGVTLGVISSLTVLGMATTTGPASGVATWTAPSATQQPAPVLGLDLHLVGTATFTPDGRIRLVDRGHGDTAGAAYTTSPVDVSSFTMKMVFHIVGDCSDGLAFIIQDEGPDALGATGGDLGYGRQTRGVPKRIQGITQSAAIELDTWQNRWDPEVPHVSLQSRGLEQNDTNTQYSLINKPVGPVADGQRHRLTVHYRDGILHVWYGGERLINNRIDLAKHLGLSDGTAFVGVTAANGGCASRTTIDDFLLSS